MQLMRRAALDGVQLDSLDDRIIIQSIEPAAGKDTLSAVSLGGADGTWPDVTKLSLIARGRPDPEGMTARLLADWDVTVHAPEVLELTPHGVDKGTGLLRALDALGIGRADSVAFGDSANDLAMFREAGMGIAMGNASGPLREKAHYVTTDLHDDGIWNAWQYLEAHP